jgi:hypothetical protein
MFARFSDVPHSGRVRRAEAVQTTALEPAITTTER